MSNKNQFPKILKAEEIVPFTPQAWQSMSSARKIDVLSRTVSVLTDKLVGDKPLVIGLDQLIGARDVGLLGRKLDDDKVYLCVGTAPKPPAPEGEADIIPTPPPEVPTEVVV